MSDGNGGVNRDSQGKRSSMQRRIIALFLFHHDFSGLGRLAVLSALHGDPAVENGSRGVLCFLSASADRNHFMAENGISRLLGNSQYFSCGLFYFDPIILLDRPDLEYRRCRPIFQKNN